MITIYPPSVSVKYIGAPWTPWTISVSTTYLGQVTLYIGYINYLNNREDNIDTVNYDYKGDRLQDCLISCIPHVYIEISTYSPKRLSWIKTAAT